MSTLEFTNVIATQSEFLKPFAVSLTRDTHNAEDLFQETMLRALRYKDKYKVGTNIKAWLFTIMRNIFINDYRRKKKSFSIFEDVDTTLSPNKAAGVVHNAAEGNIRLKEIKAVLQALPATFKKPFELYFNGYHYNEISEILNEPLGTIKSRIHIARKQMQMQIVR